MERLRAFRHLEGLTQKEMGDLIGIPHQSISHVEAGRRQLLEPDVTATGYSAERFGQLPPMSEPLHRQRASTREASRKRAKELLRLAGELFSDLSARTPRSPRMYVETLPAPMSLDEVEDRAVEVRVGVLRHEETGKISNVTSAVERAGVCLVPIAGLAGVDGLSSWVDGQPVIGLEPQQPGDRFRFTLLHELGHLTMHRTKSDVTEDEANRLAGAVLLPESDFDIAMQGTPTISDFVELKKQWGISVAALVYRARELGYVDDQRYRSLQIQMSKWRRNEPAKFDAAHGQLLPKLVELNGGIATVARETGINPEHIREVTQWSGLRLVH